MQFVIGVAKRFGNFRVNSGCHAPCYGRQGIGIYYFRPHGFPSDIPKRPALAPALDLREDFETHS